MLMRVVVVSECLLPSLRRMRASGKRLICNGEKSRVRGVARTAVRVRRTAAVGAAAIHWRDLATESAPMCGIVGAIADRDVVPVLIEGLKRLEYRGYDSAGIAVVDDDGERRPPRAPHRPRRGNGKRGATPSTSMPGSASATRAGPPTAASPKPTRIRTSATAIALVHNGIIENHEQQRERLRALGYAFESQTDTEVIAHLIHHYRAQGADLLHALQQTVGRTAWRLRDRGDRQARTRTAWSPRAWAARCWSAWARARTSSPPTCRRSCRRRGG